MKINLHRLWRRIFRRKPVTLHDHLVQLIKDNGGECKCGICKRAMSTDKIGWFNIDTRTFICIECLHIPLFRWGMHETGYDGYIDSFIVDWE